jgi:hypothetical protein
MRPCKITDLRVDAKTPPEVFREIVEKCAPVSAPALRLCTALQKPVLFSCCYRISYSMNYNGRIVPTNERRKSWFGRRTEKNGRIEHFYRDAIRVVKLNGIVREEVCPLRSQ